MRENQLREVIGKGLPKIVAAATGIYPMGFLPQMEPNRDHVLDSQLVSSQLIYTKNFQVISFLAMDATQVLRLGQRAFPKYSRLDSPKMVISANGEVLNTIVAKLGYIMGKLDDDADVSMTAPIVLNCAKENSIPIRGEESLFMSLANLDISMLFISSIQII